MVRIYQTQRRRNWTESPNGFYRGTYERRYFTWNGPRSGNVFACLKLKCIRLYPRDINLSSMPYGTLWITRDHQSIVWDDNPCCPEPFPLLQTHTKRSNVNLLKIPVRYENNVYTLYHPQLHPRDFYWAGTETIHIKRCKPPRQNQTKPKTVHPTYLSIVSGQEEPPLETLEPDNKQIYIESKPQMKPPMSLTCVWSSQDSVLRTQSGEILGIPNYIHWK